MQTTIKPKIADGTVIYRGNIEFAAKSVRVNVERKPPALKQIINKNIDINIPILFIFKITFHIPQSCNWNNS